MPTVVLYVVSAMIGLCLVAWLCGRGRTLSLKNKKFKGVLDPLTLNDIEDAAHIYLSVPNTDGSRETVPLIVDAATRHLFLKYGLMMFGYDLLSTGHINRYCLVGDDLANAKRVPLRDLQLKLFGQQVDMESVQLMHDMTEVDLMSLETDENFIAQHIANSGFLPAPA